MPQRLSVLLLLLAGLGVLSLPARADEDAAPPATADLESRAAELAARVAVLSASLAELSERLEALEKAFDREESGALDKKSRRPKPKPEAAPGPENEQPETDAEAREGETEPDGEDAPEGEAAPEDEPKPDDGLDPAIAEVVGTYRIDMETFLASMIEYIREQLTAELGDAPPELLDGAVEAVRAQLTGFEFELVLAADLTFEVTGNMGGEPTSASGTWERDGENLTLHQTHEDGEEADDPIDLVGIWDGSTLQIQPDEGIPVVLVLHKIED